MILRRYQSLGDKVEELLPKTKNKPDQIESEKLISERNEKVVALASSQKVKSKKEKVIVPKEEIEKQISRIKIFSFLHFITYLALFLLWSFMMPYEAISDQAVFMNHMIQQKFLYEFDFRQDGWSTYGFPGGTDNEYAGITDELTFWNYMDLLKYQFFTENLILNREFGSISESIKSLE